MPSPAGARGGWASVCTRPLAHRRTWAPATARASAQTGQTALQSQAGNVQPARRRVFAADDFRHPLDRENTRLLQLVPGLAQIMKTFLSPVAEEVLFMEHISTSILIGPNQLPHLHHRLLEASAILGIDSPALYIRQSPVPNAYTIAVNGRRPVIVLHTALLELLDDDETQAVIAHELGHLACDHGVWLTFANLLTMSAGSLPGMPRFVVDNFEDGLLRWLRAAELSCDRAALLVVRDPKTVVRVLMKLAGGSPKTAALLNVDAFLAQARSYDDAAASSLLGWYLSNAQTRGLSHPLPVARAREIDSWSSSSQFRDLLRRLPPPPTAV